MMRAGRLRDRVVIEREVETGKDQWGQVLREWQPLATLWADLRATRGRELVAAGRLEGTAVGTLRLRHSALTASITAADRVVARGHVWAIVSAPHQIYPRPAVIEMVIERGGPVGVDMVSPDPSARVLAGDEAGNGRALAGDEAGNTRIAA